VSAGGGTKAIIAALGANAGIAAAKFAGFLVTGSSSMLAESVHSLADTTNQGLLLLGQKTSKRAADREHPFGYGRDRYFYSFIVALLLFTLGSAFAIYEGIHKIGHPEPLESPIVAVVILLVAVGLEGYSFYTAVGESRKIKGDVSWWGFIRQAKEPELPVVLLEDAGALLGLVFALLGVIAVILIVEMKSLLIGEGVTEPVLATIVDELAAGKVERVIHIRTQYLGPDELLVAAKLAMVPGLDTAELATAIDDAEARVRAKVPVAKLIYLEPDLDRSLAK
jgi:divalent metal cation (Fe/Co/Zn/Cd) transporter